MRHLPKKSITESLSVFYLTSLLFIMLNNLLISA